MDELGIGLRPQDLSKAVTKISRPGLSVDLLVPETDLHSRADFIIQNPVFVFAWKQILVFPFPHMWDESAGKQVENALAPQPTSVHIWNVSNVLTFEEECPNPIAPAFRNHPPLSHSFVESPSRRKWSGESLETP